MAKKKHKKATAPVQAKPSGPMWARFAPWQLDAFCVVFIVIVLIINFSPIVFDGLSPTGADVIGNIGKTHQIKEFEKATGERALWNPNIFSGMPLYYRLSPKEPALDYILHILIQFLFKTPGWNGFVYFIIGALGLYYLVRFWLVPRWGALLVSLAFALMPSFEAMFSAGHYFQLRPIMLMPWVVLAFSYLLQKGTWVSAMFFMLAISLQIRTKHYQIIFYTLLILLFIGVAYKIQILRKKAWKAGTRRVLLFLVALVIAIPTFLQPLIPVQEYAKYSIRGGSGETGGGLDYDYATGWSFSPKEMLSLLVPNAFGGSSSVLYKGSAVPQLTRRTIPGYWGDMPFTEGGDYLGIIPFILAAVGCVYAFRQKRAEWIALCIFIPFALLLSFGKHAPVLYDLFFRFVPFFNKFRVPVMILAAVYFSATVLAGLGFKALWTDKDAKKYAGFVLGLGGFLFLVSMSPFLFRALFSFEKAGEAGQYGEQVMNLIRAARLDLMRQDAIRLLVFSGLGCSVIWLYLKNKVPKSGLAILLGVLLLADMLSIDKRFLKNLGPSGQVESTHFAETATDKFLNQDEGVYRVLPLQQDIFQTNDWSYDHQSVGGYAPDKLRIYQDVIEDCFFSGKDPEIPVNWNLVNMLNAKYVIVAGRLDEPFLELVNTDNRTKKLTYLNRNALDRAWFAGATEVIPHRQARLARLNDQTFHPDSSAILEKPLDVAIAKPADASVQVTRFEPNRIDFAVTTDVQSLLVVSEIYYPKGWTATIDGKPTEILKTDHILRSLVVPAGSHEIRMVFAPKSYRVASTISFLTNGIVLLGLIGIGGFQLYRKRKAA